MNDCRYIRTKPVKNKRVRINDDDDREYETKPDERRSLGFITDKKAQKKHGIFSRYTRSRESKIQTVSKYETVFSDIREHQGPLKNVITVLLYLYVSSLYVLAYSPKYNIIARGLFMLLLSTTVINILMSGQKLKVIGPDILITLFGIFASFSSIWVVSEIEVSNTVSTIIQLVILYYVIRINAYSENDIRTMLYAMVAGTVIMCLYTVAYYGVGTIISTILAGGRIGDEINQMNGMGMYCSILTTISLYFVLYENKYWFLAILPLSLFVQFGCNSRKGFALVFIGVFIIVFFRAGKMKAFILLGSVVFVYVFVLLCNKYHESNEFFNRMYKLINMLFGDDEGDYSAYIRRQMIQYGIKLFREKPILGYGPAQFEYYYSLLMGMRRPPHSTFIQFLVSFGLTGFTLFYSSYLYFIANFVTMFRKRLKYALLFLALLIMMIVNDFGANMLTNKFLYIFAALFASYDDLKKRNHTGDFIEEKMQHGYKHSKFEKLKEQKQ